MCGAIAIECETKECNNLVRYDTICDKCINNILYPTGV